MSKNKLENYSFQAETKQLLNLMINSIYSNKDIFIRELVSNASDALDKLRFESLTNKKFAKLTEKLEIRIDIDEKENSICITDTGIGLSKKDAIENLGTIAKSGTKEFLEKLTKNKKEEAADFSQDLIGQFGVGFYSSFMVAKKVEVRSKRAGEDKGIRWISKGDGAYTIEEIDKKVHGTEISLFLKDREELTSDYASFHTLQALIKKYSNYIRYPIIMTEEHEEVEKDAEGNPIKDGKKHKVSEDKVINSSKPIWMRSKSEVSKEEYIEFYKHISNDWQEPFEQLSLKVEGKLEYTSLLFFPKKAPHDLYYPTYTAGLQLYTKRVMIMEKCEQLLPKYLRFVVGVVDSNDLPLNISREILQDNPHITQMSKRITKKIIDYLANLMKKEKPKYVEFFQQFGTALKEGISSDFENKEKLENLLLFPSTHNITNLSSLSEYVSRMPDGQNEIYYLSAENIDAAKSSPHLEIFQEKGYEVLFFVEPIDEFMTQFLREFDKKSLKSVHKGDVELDSEEDKKNKTTERDEQSKEYKSINEFLQKILEDKVKEVRISSRLVSSPVCLVVDEAGMSPHVEKMLQSMQQGGGEGLPTSKRIMEINPKHPVIAKMKQQFNADKESTVLKDYAELLYGHALLTEGSEIVDASKFNKALSQLMLKGI